MESPGAAAADFLQEIEFALQDDETRIGDVFRLQRDGKDPQETAEKLGLGAPNSVYAYRHYIQTLFEGRRITEGTIYAKHTATAIRGFLKRHDRILSEENFKRLQELETEHSLFATNEDEVARENRQNERVTESNIPRGVAGVYVYTYPHYLKYPVLASEEDDTNSRTYLKIGKSDKDMADRINQQIADQRKNNTALPEPPIILRMYSCPDGNVLETEKRIQNHLNAVDHNQNHTPGAGREWFLTHVVAIDSTAELLGLETVHRYEDYPS